MARESNKTWRSSMRDCILSMRSILSSFTSRTMRTSFRALNSSADWLTAAPEQPLTASDSEASNGTDEIKSTANQERR